MKMIDMVKKTLFLMCIVIFLTQCNAQNNKLLIIEGDNICVREYPTAGDVIMKLNQGDKCEVLKKDKKETIKGVTDYWYKIKYNNEIGWVFGSHTSLSQTAIIGNEEIKNVLINHINIQAKGLKIKVVDREEVNMDIESSIWILFEFKINDNTFSLVKSYYFGDDPEVYVVRGKVKKGTKIEEMRICSEKIYDPSKIYIDKDKIIATVPVIEGCTLGVSNTVGNNTETHIFEEGKYKKL